MTTALRCAAVVAATLFTSIGVVGAQEFDEDVDSAPPTRPIVPLGGSDFDQTLGAWGFEVVAQQLPPGLVGAATPAIIPLLGVRTWSSREGGWEAGAALAFRRESEAGVDASALYLGGTFGLIRALGVYDHLAVFWEPQGTLLVLVPDDGIDGTDNDPGFFAEARVSVGAEVRLGFIGLERIGLTTKLGAGLQVLNDGSDTDFAVGTLGGVANSVEGLLETNVGFVFYM